MAGYGLGFGSITRSRQYAVLGRNVPVAALSPSAAWDGTAGSGFAGAVPTDPVRVTAKPVCRLLTPPNQFFTDELVIGVFAAANHNGSLLEDLGLDRVIAHCEGESFDIAAPSFLLFPDANGHPRRYLGWWVVLRHPGTDGHCQVYFEAVPKDPSMQSRVIGPYQFSPAATLHDFEIEVAPSQAVVVGERYQSIGTAVNYCVSQAAQNPRITITEALTDDMWFWTQNPYNPDGYFTFEATAPVTFAARDPFPATVSFLRPRVDGCWFRGENFTFDFVMAGSVYHESPAHREHVFEGVTCTDSGGRYYLPIKGSKPFIYIARDRPYYLECDISYLQDPCNNASLVRGCAIRDGNRDAASNALCVIGNTMASFTSFEFRAELDALSVQYTGAGSATVELAGPNSTNNRVLTAKVNGSPVGTFTIQNTIAAYTADTNYSVENVAGWFNSLPGWTATVLDGTRRADALSVRDNSPLGGAFGARDAKTAPLTLVTAIDQHSDLWALAHPSSSDNVIFYGNTCYHNLLQSVFVGPPGGLRDCLIANNAFDQDESDPEYGSGSISQLTHVLSHVVVAHNSWSNQALLIRRDGSIAADGDGYCLVANNVVPQLAWTGPVDPDVTLADNHLFAGASLPAGATGTIVGGTKQSLLRDPSIGDFTPLGELLANPKPPVLRFDMAGIARGIPAAPGASAGGGEVAPAITSANPSGTYAEGVPVGGTLTANKPVSWSVTGPDAGFVQLSPALGDWELAPTDFELRTSYSFTFTATDFAGDSVEQAVAIAISDVDEIAPVLSSVLATVSGSSAADLTVSTDEANGTLHWFVSQDPSPPETAALIAGTGAVASGSRSVTATGAQAISVSGLAAGTSYFAHFLQRDGAGNISAPLSSEAFTTQPAVANSVAIVSHATVLETTETSATYVATPFAFSGTPGNILLAVVVASQNSTQSLANLSATVNGVPITLLAGGAHSGGSSRPIIGVFLASSLPAGATTVEAAVDGSARSCTILAVEVAGIDPATPLANLALREETTLAYSRSYTPDRAGNLVISVLGTRQGDRGPFTADPGVVTLQASSTGTTAINDHTVFVGYAVPPSTEAADVGATATVSAEALFLVTELNAA